MFWTIIFFICLFLFSSFAINYYKLLKLKELEVQFIVSALYYEQFRYQMHEILEVIYDKASETDPQFKQDFKAIKNKLDEKFNKVGDNWIQNLQKIVGYKLNYSSWRDLIKKADIIIRNYKNHESRKRD